MVWPHTAPKSKKKSGVEPSSEKKMQIWRVYLAMTVCKISRNLYTQKLSWLLPIQVKYRYLQWSRRPPIQSLLQMKHSLQKMNWDRLLRFFLNSIRSLILKCQNGGHGDRVHQRVIWRGRGLASMMGI